ncbi:protocatechuate 4,5-dioxygenase subunit alpha [Geodermatophilus marinus]|uniref:protocatechuate 4,5-dioxygenase subunit alpha n=1 Tax=Geodermatophilus sp. LHW52908 TaxID=2303986 RepID=UPI000E3CC06E|nr:protocatechuate 4,5-dioxygenase subunit alpha [Geodermatophilus sp. LHW52908]RFU21552.1 protocatechuate 4,5-dioxygenase subunit alpha [Geodermatophilus sp. LHW52908]
MSTDTPAGSRFDLPGTPVFDGQTSRRGLRMNKMFMSLRSEANRTRFLADEAGYCREFGLTPEQERAVLDRDWQAMIDLGGSIFYVYKLAVMDGRSMQYLGGVFTGMTEEEFVAAMRAGGRRDTGGRRDG